MPLYNFKKRFADDVESGKKLQTIRRRRKRPTVAGEMLHLYTGLRTKVSRLLRRALCTRVLPVEVHWHGVKVGPEWIAEEEKDAFARADGFADYEDFHRFWRKEHCMTEENPLTGFDLIQWEPKT